MAGDAMHEDARGAAFVHLTIEKNENRGTTSYLTCLSLAQGQSAVDKALQQRVTPVRQVVWCGYLRLDVYGL